MIEILARTLHGPGASFAVVLTALAAYALAVAIERTLALRRWRVDVQALGGRLQRGELDAGAARRLPGPVGELLAAGLAEGDPERAWTAMGARAPLAEAAYRARLGHLAAIANVATMLGLLGTVYGLVLAFAALGDTGAGERAARLSEGIATAMGTTACGLVVGIPALAVHAWLAGRVERRLAEIDHLAAMVVLGMGGARSEG